jgi:hypothetical protein
MAYSTSKFQLTHLLQAAWQRLGQFKRWTATGGSTTTAINTLWAGVEDLIYEDDDPALIYGTLVVIRDAGGAGAAPEGEFGQITDYDSSTPTITMDALSTGVAVGDRIGVASPLFPLEDMITCVNLALRRFGEIDVPDTSITIVANQSEYSLPAAIQQRPQAVYRQTVQTTSNNQWELVSGWSVVQATPGSQWTLIVPPLTVGYKLKVVYRGFHPTLYSYSADIAETIHPELAITATLAEAYQWYNNQVGGSNAYFLQRENKILQDLENAKVMYPITHSIQQIQGLPHWNTRNAYVPLTNDLRE